LEKKLKIGNRCRLPQFESLKRMSTSAMAKKQKNNEMESTSAIQICETDVDIHNGKKNETDVGNSNLQSGCRHPQ